MTATRTGIEPNLAHGDFVVELPCVFDSEECDRIVAWVATLPRTSGAIGTKDGRGAEIDPEVRRVRQTTLRCTSETQWIYDRVTRALHDCNAAHFRFDVGSLEPLVVVDYREGDFYDWHLDLGRGAASRKLSVTLMLSSPADYQGGALTFPGAVFEHVPRGNAVVFASFLLHGVHPVKKGQRLALVGWLGGPPFR